MNRNLNLPRLCWLLAATLSLSVAEKSTDKTLPVRGFCIPAPPGNRVDEFIKFLEEELAPRSVNPLILRVDNGFQFTCRPEMAGRNGLSKDHAQKITAACKCPRQPPVHEVVLALVEEVANLK